MGTGSGCIAITLALELSNTQVTASDISQEALSIARENAATLKAPVRFFESDWFESIHELTLFDVIVSNPPYVRDSEKKLMHRNVLDYEPAAALFVPDDDPLLFYRAIAGLAERFLAEDGAGAVEINEAFGDETARLFMECGFCDVRVVRDFSDRARFVIFRKP